MTKTEAAEIIANNIAAWCARHDLNDSEITNTMVAEAISRCEYETVPGSYAHSAALARPSVRSVRIAYRRSAGII
jgi:hypothetical protein